MSQLPKAFAERMTALLGEEAEAFLDDCMAVVCKNIKEVK